MSVTFVLFWISCGLFLVDMLLGKIGILSNDAVSNVVGDVPHFLLLALAAAFLTAECLQREARRKAAAAAADADLSQAQPNVTSAENPPN
jgi:hypothetical protein